MTTPVSRAAIEADPGLTPWAYGLVTAATVLTQDDGRWLLGVEFQSDNCGVARGWNDACGPDTFTATLVYDAAEEWWTLTLDPYPGSGYEISIDGGAFAPATDGMTITPDADVDVVIREVDGFHRSVTLHIPAEDPMDPPWPDQTTVTDESEPGNPPKAPEGSRPVYEGTPFTLFARGPICGPLGGDYESANAHAAAMLAAGEGRALESYYESGALGNVPALVGPGTVVLGGGSVSLMRGLGLLEQALADAYGGIGIVHAPRQVYPYFANRYLIVRDGPRLRTQLDNVLAFGAGYQGLDPVTGVLPAWPTTWIYATGPTVIRRSPVVTPASPAELLDRTTNQTAGLAERTYVITHDCAPVFAVEVDLSSEEP